jgi:hypothetical protein
MQEYDAMEEIRRPPTSTKSWVNKCTYLNSRKRLEKRQGPKLLEHLGAGPLMSGHDEAHRDLDHVNDVELLPVFGESKGRLERDGVNALWPPAANEGLELKRGP